MMTAVEWIAAESGPAGLRLWAMNGAEVLDQRLLPPVEPASKALMAAVPPEWAGLPVLLADLGRGWNRAPLPSVPSPAGLRLLSAPDHTPIWIAAGVQQAEPVGAIHGQTARIAGLLAAQPQFDGVICLPGHDSHWARISANEICHFQTYPTGDLLTYFAAAGALPEAAADPEVFAAAQEEALSRPHRAYGRLSALKGAKGADVSRLAGLLIGWEMADAKPYWLGETVAVLGADPLAGLYVDALSRQGVVVLRPDADAALLAGLYGAWKGLAAQVQPQGPLH